MKIISAIIAIAILSLSMFLVLAPSAKAQQSTVDWWPMFHHDLMHTGYSTSIAPSTNQTLWSYTTGGAVDSSPAVVDGVVYVGSNDHNVYALNALTGTLVWSYTTGGAVGSSPAVAEGLVFVGSSDDNVYAFSASTGALVWNYTTDGPVGSSPAVAGGVVYVGSDDGNVYALNAVTGLQIWNYTTDGPVGSSPAVAGGVVYVGDHDGDVYALNAITGTYVWSFLTGGPVPSSPVVNGGVVYVGSDDWHVYALNAATGSEVWGSCVYGSVPCSPAVANGLVYVGSEDYNVYALNETTGDVVWTYLTGAGVGFSSPAVAGGMVFIGSGDDNVYALNAANGALIWSSMTGGMLSSSAAVGSGNVYIGSDDGNVYAFGSVPGLAQLTVASAYGSPSPSGTSSYALGTTVTASVTSPVAGPSGTQYVCTGWTGTGDVPASGTGTSVTFNVTQDSTITWNWKTQYEVSFGQSGVGSNLIGTVVTIDGSNYNVSALPVSFWYDDGSTHSFAFQSPLVVRAGQYSWNSTTGLSTLQSASINITGPGGVTGNYVSGVHDVVVTEITTSSTWVYQGHVASINVTVSDIGSFPEDVWVTLYYNVTADESIDAYPVYLGVGQTYTLLFTWNTVDVPCLNYTLTAVATIPTGSNTLSNGTIAVRLLGDVNGDGRIDLKDIALVARAFGSHEANYDYPGEPASPNWNPFADIDGNGVVNMKDLSIVVRNFSPVRPFTVLTNITITASDPNDSYVRYWGLTFDRPMPPIVSFQGFVGANVNEVHASGDTMTVQWTLSPGQHYLIFGVTQTGGPSYGTYSGTITINGNTYSFTGLDADHTVTINFTV